MQEQKLSLGWLSPGSAKASDMLPGVGTHRWGQKPHASSPATVLSTQHPSRHTVARAPLTAFSSPSRRSLSVPAAGLLHFELPSIHLGGVEATLRRDPLDAAQRVQLKGPAEEEEDSESTAL